MKELGNHSFSEITYTQVKMALPGRPEVIYEDGVNNQDSPCTIEIDANLLGDLLRDHEILDSEIDQIRVLVKPRLDWAWPHLLGVAGTWNDESRDLEINAGIVKSFVADLRTSSEIATSEKQGKAKFTHIRTTRFPGYLVSAPPERTIGFARWLLEQKSENRLQSVLLHEVGHAVDYFAGDALDTDRKSRIINYLVGAGLIVSSFLIYHFSQNREIVRSINSAVITALYYKFILGVSGIEYYFRPTEMYARDFSIWQQGDNRWNKLVKVSFKKDGSIEKDSG